MGVDIFFVISGFLITSLLFQDIEDGSFSLLQFYARRIRRIVPALVVMILITTMFGYPLLSPGDYVTFAKSAMFAAFGGANFFFYWNTGYFDRAAEFLPLLHTWSLGVEEQFYIIWPVLLAGIVIAARPRWMAIIGFIGLLIVTSFATSIITLQYNPKAAFYFPQTRAWELALGALLVFMPPLLQRVGEAANVVGLALITIGVFTISVGQPFPGWNALLPCCGSALVIWPKKPTTTARALGWLRALGLISYSLYLWHWPIWVFYRLYANGSRPGPGEVFGLTAISIIVAYLSRILVEEPFLARKARRHDVMTIGIGVAAMAVVASVSIIIMLADGFTFRLDPSRMTMKSLPEMWHWDCRSATIDNAISNACVFGADWKSAKIHGVLWGDSQAIATMPLLDPIARDTNASFVLWSGCPAILDGARVHVYLPEQPAYRAECATKRSVMMHTLKSHPEMSLVVLTAAWPYMTALIADDRSQPDAKVSAKLLEQSLQDTVTEIGAPDRKIVPLGSVPQWPGNDTFECAYRDPALWRAKCAPEKTYSLRCNLELSSVRAPKSSPDRRQIVG